MTAKPLLYSYIRFSTIEQAKGHSLSRQLTYAKKVADEKGIELDESLTMKDLGLSAFHKTNIKRGALGLFLEAIDQGKVPAGSILVIESLDRISRAAPIESQGIVAQIINADITVITAVDGKEYNKDTIKKNPMDLVYIVIVLIRANEESESKSIRVRAAYKKQCENWLEGIRGFRVKCGKAPKWVRWDEDIKAFVFEPREKKIMLRKVEHFKKGLGGLRIAELINEEFGKGTVHHTGANVYKEVKRRSLIGELNTKVGDKDYVLKGYYPPLMTENEFNSLVSDSNKRGATKHSQKFVGILSGIDVFKCACCGNSVGSHVTYRGLGIEDVPTGNKRYGCVEARRNNNCLMKSTVQLDVVESVVALFCQDRVNLRRILLQDSDKEELREQENKLNSKLKELQKNIESLMNTLLVLDGKPPQAIADKIKQLESEESDVKLSLEKIRNELSRVGNTFRDEVTEKWLGITENLSKLGSDTRLSLRQLVKDTFKSIILSVDLKESDDLIGLEKLIELQLMGDEQKNYFDLTLEFHNGKKRLLRLDKHSGKLLTGFEN
ncbi:MAG: recombinase family protein [Paraglaciecola sp.]|uniref:recombinase family protein n=1 Tax=Paraglaciecola sp. TaxID=1920173 RepID=UPI0032994E94